jgi:hypothetical protein
MPDKKHSDCEVGMRAGVILKRRAFFVDDRTLHRAKQILGVKTNAEAIRLSVERVVEMEEFWQFLKKSRQTLKPGSFAEP